MAIWVITRGGGGGGGGKRMYLLMTCINKQHINAIVLKCIMQVSSAIVDLYFVSIMGLLTCK